MLHEAELLQSDERAAQRYGRQAEELRDLLEREKEEQRERARQRYVVAMGGAQRWFGAHSMGVASSTHVPVGSRYLQQLISMGSSPFLSISPEVGDAGEPGASSSVGPAAGWLQEGCDGSG